MNEKGLPQNNLFYTTKQNEKKTILKLSDNLPRILNIASGSNPEKKIYAINIDLDAIGNPEIICDAKDLSAFPDNYFTIVRASHILEHFYPDEIESVLNEWIRVLHKNGEIHIAVPDARIVLDELESGKVKNSDKPSFDFLNTTAPIAQLYGVGYEDAKTDPRWRHHIIFNYELLCWYLKRVGLEVVELMTNKDDMAGACGINDDSQNHYSLIVRARRAIKPHEIKRDCPIQVFKNKLNEFTQKNSIDKKPPLSVIVPVRNESKNIQNFLKNLLLADATINDLFEREYIIVCNGTTDNSVELITNFTEKNPKINIRLTSSEPGILNAFYAGICARKLNGFVAKLDADCIVNDKSICLMYIKLFENKDLQVTYTEPIPVGAENPFNTLQFHQSLRSQRLHIHGRCSMYKKNPFELFDFKMIKNAGCLVEDIILSYCFAFFYGLDSIKCTDHALIYSKPIDTKEDFEKKIIRINREISLIEKSFPYFIPLRNLLDRKLMYNSQAQLHKNTLQVLTLYTSLKYAQKKQDQEHEWYRLESTKNVASSPASLPA